MPVDSIRARRIRPPAPLGMPDAAAHRSIRRQPMPCEETETTVSPLRPPSAADSPAVTSPKIDAIPLRMIEEP